MIKLSVIILSYNTKELTTSCIKSLINNYKKYLENGEIEIIIVDNASTDGSPSEISRLRQDFGGQANLKVILNKENVGFAKGCNIGANVAKGKYVLFLNSDTQVLDNGFFQMIDYLDNHQAVGILGGRLANPDGSLQPSSGKFYNLFNLFLMLLGMERFGMVRGSPKDTQRVDWVSGACMMLRKDIFDKLKGFDENLFMYMEDMEFCYRAGKSDFPTYFYKDIKLIHKGLGSGDKEFAIIQIYKGISYFYLKHKSFFQYTTARTMLVIKAIVAILVGALTLNVNLLNTYRRAIKALI